ncbi:glycoside hydrolase family 55 protein [Butyriboletus roseoflavus]|nr:glycoside hydrolase family 55 protein [Butyriboletus roseoflavus]
MRFSSALLLLSTILYTSRTASGLGSSCSSALGGGTAASTDPYWLETITHQGTAPFNPNPSSYQVFRNVKDYGAKGDGVTDDTAAIKLVIDDLARAFVDVRVRSAAMSSGGRCGGGTCSESTLSPAIVYFPRGIYLVTAPIDTYYYTQMIGDAKNPPTLLAGSSFIGFAVIDTDPYIPNGYGAEWFTNQDNFFRSVRNLIIDLRQIPSGNQAFGLHWQVAQGTSLFNIVVEMSTASGTQHQGIFMENGSGGVITDLVFNGGHIGIEVGNQQLTVRNLTINNANIAVSNIWDWGFTFQGVTINNCQVGFAIGVGGETIATQGVGSDVIVDAVVTNTPIFIQASVASNGTLPYSLILNNIQLSGVPTAVGDANGTTILAGGTTTIASWAQGNEYSGTSDQKTWVQGNIASPNKPSVLLDSSGRIFGKAHPQYASYAVDQFISVKSQGAKGDGQTDDTSAIQNVFNQYAGCKIIFFDAGVYYVTDTISIPAGTRITGEAWSVILAGGSNFQSQGNPRVVVQAGTSGSQDVLEISDMVFSTAGPTPGAIVLEWNVHDPSGQQGAAGLWDTHIRGPGYGPADHDLDAPSITDQISVFTGRGILSESAGPVWLIGTSSEHAALYQYNLVNAQNHYIGFAQTETPYYQPVPVVPAPYSIDSTYHDPSYPSGLGSAWSMYIQSSSNILLFGAGFYSFYQNYVQTCLTPSSCQSQIFNVDSASSVTVWSVSTVGTTYQLSVNGNGVINQANNLDGFQSTFTTWTP